MDHDYSPRELYIICQYVAALLAIYEMACEMMLYLNLRYDEGYCPMHGWEDFA